MKRRNTTFMTWNLMHLGRMLQAAGGVPGYGKPRSARGVNAPVVQVHAVVDGVKGLPALVACNTCRMQESHVPQRRSFASTVDALQQVTRDLLGLAVRSVDEVGEVSLPQMRLLFALRDGGQATCTQLAHVLDVNGSSVTRLADRLAASGHLVRLADPDSRSRVLLSLTEHGNDVIDAVLAWRSRELTRALHTLDAPTLDSLTRTLDVLHERL